MLPALRAARAYYERGETMEAIARELHVSRSSVSRLIAHARDTGLVEITVHAPDAAKTTLEQEIGDRYGVRAHVVSAPPRVGELERLDVTAQAAARVLAGLVDSGMTIGVAWGATITALARHLTPRRTTETRIVQMNGAANVRTTGIPYAGEILAAFGDAFSASVQPFPVPAIFDDPETKRLMWKERSIRTVRAQQEATNLFVFGLGSPRADVPSHVYTGDYFDRDTLMSIARAGIVGDCATRFYRADGSTDGIALNDRSSGPDLDVVRSIPRRLCVVSGLSKAASLRGALRARLITDLVVEESLCRRLLTDEDDAVRARGHAPAASSSRSPKPSSKASRTA